MKHYSRRLSLFVAGLVALLLGASGSAPVRAVSDGLHFWYEPRLPAASLNSLAFGTTSKSVVITSGSSGRSTLMRSTDGGVSWKELTGWQPNEEHSPYRVVTWAAKPNAFIAFGAVSMYVTEDNGDSWSAFPYPTYCGQITSVLPHPTEPATIYVGSTHGFVRTIDGGTTWDWFGGSPICSGGPYAHTMAASGNIIYAGEFDNYGGGVYRSDDRGMTWSKASNGLPASHTDKVVSIVKVVIDPRNAAVVYALTEDGQVYKTTNSGARWNQVAQGLGDEKLNTIFLLASEEYVLYGTSNTQIYALAKGGNTWELQDTPPLTQANLPVDIEGLGIDRHFPERYIVYESHSLYTYLPKPSLDTISPQSVIVGSEAFTLTVRGNDFTRAAKVYWNGEVRPTTFVDSEQLTAAISATDIVTSTTIPVAVGYPPAYNGPIQAISSTQPFTIKPACVIDGVLSDPCAATITPEDERNLVYSAKQGTSTTITIPTGSVTTTTTLTYASIPKPDNTSSFQFAGSAFSLTAGRDEQSLAGFQFEKPITMTLAYTDTDVVGVNELDLKLYYWDGTAWADAATTCVPASAYDRKPDENTLSVAVCHLTEFALLAQGKRMLYAPLVQR